MTVNNNSPIQDYVHPDDQTQPTFEMTQTFHRTRIFNYKISFEKKAYLLKLNVS